VDEWNKALAATDAASVEKLILEQSVVVEGGNRDGGYGGIDIGYFGREGWGGNGKITQAGSCRTDDLQKHVITGAKMTSTAMINYFKSKMEAIIDRGTKVPHEQLAA